MSEEEYDLWEKSVETKLQNIIASIEKVIELLGSLEKKLDKYYVDLSRLVKESW